MKRHFYRGGSALLAIIFVSVISITILRTYQTAYAEGLRDDSSLGQAPVDDHELSASVELKNADEEFLLEKVIDSPKESDAVLAANDILDVIQDINEVEDQAEEPKQPAVYKVKLGDSLAKIAKKHNIKDWKRLYYKNTKISDPDSLKTGLKITIPEDSEKLKSRELPVSVAQSPAPVQAAEPSVTSEAETAPSSSGASSAPEAAYRPAASSSSGNTYHYGYCTWYVKNQRPDLPNSLGNANTWYSRAAALGYSVGSTPRVGAVGAHSRGAYGHVVLVEAVHGNGTITVSEMNRVGWGVRSTRTTSASEFVYIY